MLSGGRVMPPNGQLQIVVPWSETLRYGSRKNGYHGGITLQEMLVPITLLTTGNALPEGLRYAPSTLPAWWELAAETCSPSEDSKAPAKAVSKKAKPPTPIASGQQALFELPALEVAQVTADEQDWITSLLESPAFLSQKQWVARAAVKDEENPGAAGSLVRARRENFQASPGCTFVDAFDAGLRLCQCGAPLVEH